MNSQRFLLGLGKLDVGDFRIEILVIQMHCISLVYVEK